MALHSFSPNTKIESAKVNENFSALADGSEMTALETVKLTNPYKFHAYRATTAATLSNTTWTTLPLNAEKFDTNSNFSTVTYKYTVPLTGYYLLIGQMYATDADGSYVIVAILKNATSGITDGTFLAEQRDVFSGGSNRPNNCSCIAYLTAGDTITLVGYITDSTTPTVGIGEGQTFLSGILLCL